PVKYTWTPPAGLSCANCAVPNLIDDLDRKYKIEINNAQNCTANDSLLVTYLRANYFMPNVIKLQTQNIGNNNKFFIQGNISGSYDLQIFNRWGAMVFTTKDLLINDPSSGWLPSETGSPPGVYVYKVIVHTVNGDVLKAGDVTVLD
ncbi:MAG: gliding motility-associated C-terminal domain-containing protein, partial [Saprospiraceae bacterium]